jgi:hypothetical protein
MTEHETQQEQRTREGVTQATRRRLRERVKQVNQQSAANVQARGGR